MFEDDTPEEEELLINEVKLLLAEKRTYLAMFRTGLAISGLSVTALGVLIASNARTQLFSVNTAILISTVLTAIAIAGGWQVYKSRQKVNRINEMIESIEAQNKRVAEIVV